MKLLNKTDFWLGVIVIFAGLYALLRSVGFDQYSRSYPLTLSIFHILIGIGLVITSIRNISDDKDSFKKLLNDIRGPFLVVLILIVWGFMISIDLGYFISSLALIPSILIILGYRKVKNIILGTIGIVGSVFLLFYVIFDVPLPLNLFFDNLIG